MSTGQCILGVRLSPSGASPSLPPPRPQDQASKDKALQNMAALSSAQIVSPSLIKSQLPPLPHSPYPPQARVSPSTLGLGLQWLLFLCIDSIYIIVVLVIDVGYGNTVQSLSYFM